MRTFLKLFVRSYLVISTHPHFMHVCFQEARGFQRCSRAKAYNHTLTYPHMIKNQPENVQQNNQIRITLDHFLILNFFHFNLWLILTRMLYCGQFFQKNRKFGAHQQSCKRVVEVEMEPKNYQIIYISNHKLLKK